MISRLLCLLLGHLPLPNTDGCLACGRTTGVRR